MLVGEMWHFDSEKNTWLILFFFPSFYFCPVRLNMLLNMVQQVSSYSPTLLTMPLRMTWGCTQTPGTSLAQGYSEGPFTSPWGLGETPFPRGTPLTVSIHFHPPPPPFAFNKNRTVREFDWIFTNHPSRSCLSFFCSCSKQIFIRVAFPFKRTCPIMPDESDRYVLYLIGGGSSGLWGCWVDTVLWPSWLCRREWFRGVPRHLVFTRNGGTEGITVLLSECRRRSFISRLSFLWYVILVASTSGMYLFYSAKLLAQL